MKRFVCVFIIGILLCLSGCESHTRETLFAMDTVMELQIWGTDSKKAVQTVGYLLTDLEDAWSAVTPDSALQRDDLANDPLLDRAMELKKRTGGAFDPQLGAVIAAWGFMTKAIQCLLSSSWMLRWQQSGGIWVAQSKAMPVIWRWNGWLLWMWTGRS